MMRAEIKLWASEALDNQVTAKNLALDGSGNAFVIGDLNVSSVIMLMCMDKGLLTAWGIGI